MADEIRSVLREVEDRINKLKLVDYDTYQAIHLLNKQVEALRNAVNRLLNP